MAPPLLQYASRAATSFERPECCAHASPGMLATLSRGPCTVSPYLVVCYKRRTKESALALLLHVPGAMNPAPDPTPFYSKPANPGEEPGSRLLLISYHFRQAKRRGPALAAPGALRGRTRMGIGRGDGGAGDLTCHRTPLGSRSYRGDERVRGAQPRLDDRRPRGVGVASVARSARRARCRPCAPAGASATSGSGLVSEPAPPRGPRSAERVLCLARVRAAAGLGPSRGRTGLTSRRSQWAQSPDLLRAPPHDSRGGADGGGAHRAPVGDGHEGPVESPRAVLERRHRESLWYHLARRYERPPLRGCARRHEHGPSAPSDGASLPALARKSSPL